MSKAVLISIRPKWVELIASGKKTIEVRKTRPQIPAPFKCYIYCTAGGDTLYSVNGKVQPLNTMVIDLNVDTMIAELNGYVVGEFVCNRIAEICLTDEGYDLDCPKMTALSYAEMEAYLGRKNGYGWHISALKIYDKPKKLSEFCRPCPKDRNCTACNFWFPAIMDYGRCEPPCCGFWEDDASMICRPPQSYMYVEELTP